MGHMNNDTDHQPTTLIIGGHGKTGRRVAERLAAAGRATRIASRSTAPAFDWNDRSTWPAVLDGVSSAYVTFQPDLAVPGSVEVITALGAAARTHGLDHLVLLSGRGEPEAQACERALADSGVPTTVVRCSFFAQNFSEHFLVSAVQEGVIALPAGNVTEPIVDADDIAEVAAAALLGRIPGGRVYELTGPRLLTFHDVAADLSAATGRPIVYLPVSTQEYVPGAIEAGVPADEAIMLGGLFAHIFDGHNSSLATGVTEALGRPARDFAEFATQAAAGGAWNVETSVR
jgi:uncharacterized protein YbjT (DUF2867 family)